MNKFGGNSLRELDSADLRLQTIAGHVLLIKDHSILKGHRGQLAQVEAFRSGASKLDWPHGKHNGMPSKALDVQTYPRPAKKQDLREEQLYLLGLYVGFAAQQGVKLRTGADWDTDGEVSDNGWDDLFHVEILDDV